MVGNQNDVATSTTAGTVLMGGGTDVDAAFQWMIDRSGRGDFVVIRTTGTDAYNSYIKSLGQVDSVATLCDPDRRSRYRHAARLRLGLFPSHPGPAGSLSPQPSANLSRGAGLSSSGSGSFDFINWQGNGGTAYSISAERGRLTSTQPGGGIY